MKSLSHILCATGATLLSLALVACTSSESSNQPPSAVAGTPSSTTGTTASAPADTTPADTTPANTTPAAAASTASEPEFATLGQIAPNFTLADHTGATHSLADFRGKHVVLEWVNYDCPVVVAKYKDDTMQGLQRDYTAKDVVWLSICSSATGTQGYMDTITAARRFGEQKASATALLLDEDGKVGRRYQAKTTPHMYVIDASGNLVYDGAIDDRKNTNYVAETLDALLAGTAVEPRATKPYGCSVKYRN